MIGIFKFGTYGLTHGHTRTMILRSCVKYCTLVVILFSYSVHGITKYTSCADVANDGTSKPDGEYDLFLENGVGVQIYCKGLHTGNPAEYLTLRAGKSKNFAYFYENVGASDSCADKYPKQLYQGRGRSEFTRIKIDLRKLVVDINDFTFANQTGDSQMRYGTAGDSYTSSGTCQPKGAFQVDLEGTPFSVTKDITWQWTGTLPTGSSKSDMVHITNSTYMGCWIDKAERVLQYGRYDSDHSMTIEACRDHCRDLRFLYAGVEFSVDCHCGNNYDRYGSAPESQCDKQCSGDPAQICGGLWKISVYATAYMGCWIDKAERVLQYGRYDSDHSMTIEACRDHCRNLGFLYAGVQFSVDCHCGNNYDRYGSAPESQCDKQCSGDPAQICGGLWKMSVYATVPSQNFIGRCGGFPGRCFPAKKSNPTAPYLSLELVTSHACLTQSPCQNERLCVATSMSQYKCVCYTGYTGVNCEMVAACDSRHFGFQCAQLCACQNGGVCDHVTGSCRCQPGWSGEICDEPCPVGRYGTDCSLVCKECLNDGTCDTFSGLCLCPPGFTGNQCNSTLTIAAPTNDGKQTKKPTVAQQAQVITVTTGINFTSGQLAGLIIGMMLFTLVIAVVVAIAVRFRYLGTFGRTERPVKFQGDKVEISKVRSGETTKQTTSPGLRTVTDMSFANPVHGLEERNMDNRSSRSEASTVTSGIASCMVDSDEEDKGSAA